MLAQTDRHRHLGSPLGSPSCGRDQTSRNQGVAQDAGRAGTHALSTRPSWAPFTPSHSRRTCVRWGQENNPVHYVKGISAFSDYAAVILQTLRVLEFLEQPERALTLLVAAISLRISEAL